MKLSLLPRNIASVISHPIKWIDAATGIPLFRIPEFLGTIRDVAVGDGYHARMLVRPGDVIIDAGAHIGIFSKLTAGLGARVFAFAPCRETFEILHKRFSHSKNVTIVN